MFKYQFVLKFLVGFIDVCLLMTSFQPLQFLYFVYVIDAFLCSFCLNKTEERSIKDVLFEKLLPDFPQ